MFLFRTALCLGAVLFFLPTAPSAPGGDEPKIGAAQALFAASAAFADMRQFCSRQPDVCSVGSQAAAAVAQKAQTAAKSALALLSSQFAPEDVGASAAKAGAGPFESDSGAGTLTDADRAIPWRGQPGRPTVFAKHAP